MKLFKSAVVFIFAATVLVSSGQTSKADTSSAVQACIAAANQAIWAIAGSGSAVDFSNVASACSGRQ